MPGVLGPVPWRCQIDFVFDIEPCATLDQQLNDRAVSGQCRLMQRRAVRVITLGIEPVGILAGVEQQADHLHVSKLRGKREGPMPALAVGLGQ